MGRTGPTSLISQPITTLELPICCASAVCNSGKSASLSWQLNSSKPIKNHLSIDKDTNPTLKLIYLFESQQLSAISDHAQFNQCQRNKIKHTQGDFHMGLLNE